jgi:hypothetical protein
MTRKVVSLILVGLFLLGNLGHSQAEVFAGMAVSDVVTTISDQLQEVIRQTEDSTNGLMFNARTHALVLLQNTKFLGEQLQGKVFDNISEEQRIFFNNVNEVLSKWQGSNMEALAELEYTTSLVDAAFATLPFSKPIPRVFKYSPGFDVYRDANSNEYTLKFEGRYLAFGDPELLFDEQVCILKNETENNLEFTCKLADLVDGIITSHSGTLTVFEKQNFFQRIGRIFGDNRQRHTYQVSLSVIPKVWGKVEGTVNLNEPAEERRTREEGFSNGNEHCKGSREVVIPFQADAANGWQIDVTTVNLKSAETSADSRIYGLVNVTSASFGVSGQVKNNGECVKAFGKVISYDGRGKIWGSVEFQEFRTTTQTVTRNFQDAGLNQSGELIWSEDVPFQLPSNEVGFNLTVTQFDGSVKVADKSGDYGWFTVSYDPSTHLVVLRTKSVEEALGN